MTAVTSAVLFRFERKGTGFHGNESLKATFHLTISMRGKPATGKIQRNNYRHGS